MIDDCCGGQKFCEVSYSVNQVQTDGKKLQMLKIVHFLHGPVSFFPFVPPKYILSKKSKQNSEISSAATAYAL